MLFTSLHFLWFFAAVWASYWILARRRSAQNVLLLGASAFFYGYWDWRFLLLILASTLLDFGAGLWLERPGLSQARRKAIVTTSLVFNLGALALFKYYDFFVESAAELLQSFGFQAHDWTLRLVLPVGISFYTFQTLSYTIGRYRGTTPVARNLIDFATYVAFFPQLVAGPIVRAEELLPQLQTRRRFRWSDQAEGLELAMWGLFKKVVIADNLAPAVDAVFGAESEVGWLARLIAVYAFTVQIYCDFSGYTDIARGTAQALGFRFPLNFRRPYFSSDAQEFWRRWHMTLSTWLRDYLYISLGGNRRGPRRTQLNLMLTMLLGGLWHGAAWNFVLWGGYQGLLLIGHRIWAGRRGDRAHGVVGRALVWFGFMQLVCFGWLLFRAESLEQILAFVTPTDASALAGLALSETVVSGLVLGGAGAVLLIFWDLLQARAEPRETPLIGAPVAVRVTVTVGLVLLVSLFGRFLGNDFIYFQF
ncbi:MAG: MBOAT family O-acyltransferase [Planctomycetota bacterium]|jgi:D-alanyl-lipoteichoic acid acyltransferase DltB (MBOAT superfamily)